MEESTVTTIAKNEERLAQAMLNSDTEELEKLLSPELKFSAHTGMIIGKQDDIGAHVAGIIKIDKIDLIERTIIPRQKTAVVLAKVKVAGSFVGTPTSGTFQFMRVWSEESDGKWQVLAGQSTQIPETSEF